MLSVMTIHTIGGWNIMEIKTSEDWSKSVDFMGLVILDPDGWDRRPDHFEYAWYKQMITRKEFERRVCMSTIEWRLPKL